MLQQRFSRTRTALLGAVMLLAAGVTAGLIASPAAATPQHSSVAVKDAVSTRPVPGHASPAVSSLTLAGIPDDQRLKGDFNGDGKSDIAVLYDYGSARTGFRVLLSTGSSFQAPAMWYDSGPGNWNWSASKPVAGDFNGDGKSDIAVLYDYGYATVNFVVLLSTGYSFGPPQSWYAPVSGSWDGNSSKLTVGDFNGDGKSDLAVLYNYGSATIAFRVLPSTGYSFTLQNWYTSGSGSWDWNASKPVAGDFNGDGKSDIAVLYDYGSANTGFLVMPSTGSSFIGPQLWYLSGAGNWNWSASKPVAGDFNGDGKSDIAVLYDYGYATVNFVVSLSTGHSFGPPQSWYAPVSGSWDGNSSKLTVGDFNGDGKSDLAVLYNYGSATIDFRVLPSTGSSFAAPQSWYTSGSGSWDWNLTLLA